MSEFAAPSHLQRGDRLQRCRNRAHFDQPAEFANLMSVVLNETMTAN